MDARPLFNPFDLSGSRTASRHDGTSAGRVRTMAAAGESPAETGTCTPLSAAPVAVLNSTPSAVARVPPRRRASFPPPPSGRGTPSTAPAFFPSLNTFQPPARRSSYAAPVDRSPAGNRRRGFANRSPHANPRTHLRQPEGLDRALRPGRRPGRAGLPRRPAQGRRDQRGRRRAGEDPVVIGAIGYEDGKEKGAGGNAGPVVTNVTDASTSIGPKQGVNALAGLALLSLLGLFAGRLPDAHRPDAGRGLRRGRPRDLRRGRARSRELRQRRPEPVARRARPPAADAGVVEAADRHGGESAVGSGRGQGRRSRRRPSRRRRRRSRR
jgi:hypothetical protein